MSTDAFPHLEKDAPGVLKTLPECFAAGLAKSADKPFLGHRPVVSTNPLKYANHFSWLTYRQVDERRCSLGSGIHKLFLDGTAGGGELPTVGIWCQNCPGSLFFSTFLGYAYALTEWQVIDLSLHAYGKVGVSLYDTLGPDAVGAYLSCSLLQFIIFLFRAHHQPRRTHNNLRYFATHPLAPKTGAQDLSHQSCGVDRRVEARGKDRPPSLG